MEAKNVARDSVIIILFSQASKLLTIAFGTGFSGYDLSMLPYMIFGGVLGGFIGAKFNRIFSNEIILRVFNTITILIIGLNIYNFITTI